MSFVNLLPYVHTIDGSVINTDAAASVVNGSCASLSSEQTKNITSIGSYTFGNCTSLVDISNAFPNVTSIGDNAFAGCTSLTAVSFPKVTSIDDYAFDSCTSLVNISNAFPLVTTISTDAFYNCTALTTVSFPKVTTINNYAFSGCAALTSVSIGSSITSIDSAAFNGCTQSGLTITINRSSNAITGSPWGATHATIVWNGTT